MIFIGLLVGLLFLPLYFACGVALVTLSAMPGLSGFSYYIGSFTFVAAVILSPSFLLAYFKRRRRKIIQGFGGRARS